LARSGFDFGAEFRKKLAEGTHEYGVKGIITAGKRIYPLGTDTKVLSTIFEAIARPTIYEIAAEHGLTVKEPSVQNVYPDFTLMEDEADPAKIAVDVKSTYYVKDTDRVVFTLGGYTSFIRDQCKSILYPYDQYAEEWVIGYIYKQKAPEEVPAHIYDFEDFHRVAVPFDEVKVFVQQKWKISGDVAGSGNTTNIGSIRGRLDDFEAGRTPFNDKAEFLAYWRGYGKTKATRAYKNIAEFRIKKKEAETNPPPEG